MCKEFTVIPVDRVVDKKWMIGKIWRATTQGVGEPQESLYLGGTRTWRCRNARRSWTRGSRRSRPRRHSAPDWHSLERPEYEANFELSNYVLGVNVVNFYILENFFGCQHFRIDWPWCDIIFRTGTGHHYWNGVSCMKELAVTGWPDCANFRLLGDCYLWPVYWKLQKYRKFYDHVFPQYQLCLKFDKNLFGLHFGQLFRNLIWSPCWQSM
jgi:hypothetical protein